MHCSLPLFATGCAIFLSCIPIEIPVENIYARNDPIRFEYVYLKCILKTK